MEFPPSMHDISEPIRVIGDKLVINSKQMFPYKGYRFRFLNTNMVAMLQLNPDRVDIWEDIKDGK